MTTPEKKKDRTPSDETAVRRVPDRWTLAAKLARRLEQLRRDTDAELLNTPQAIEARYEAKRAALVKGADCSVLEALPAGMLREDELP